jgi:hydroxyethylthiazole kinase-like uncharacterized protein yjeF
MVVERMRYGENSCDVTRSNYRDGMSAYREFTIREAASELVAPAAADDKYSRGVLGVVTGSADYPGAAVLGVEAALRTGVGMVRYLGAADHLVLARRPEAVTRPGRVQAWLIGSGIDAGARDEQTEERLRSALGDGVPVVMDSGALDLLARASGAVVITPHYRELASLLAVDAEVIAADPATWCSTAVDRLGVTVLLKGSRTMIASPSGDRWVTGPATPWLASAGTGDVLAGILGALVASRADAVAEDPGALARLAATAAVVHAETAARVSGGGPLLALDLATAVSATVASLLHPVG